MLYVTVIIRIQEKETVDELTRSIDHFSYQLDKKLPNQSLSTVLHHKNVIVLTQNELPFNIR